MVEVKERIKHFFISLFAVLIKNFKIIFRSKTSIFTIIFGPLLVMTLLVLAFNNSGLHDIHVTTYSQGYSAISNQIIANLELNDYIITKVDNKTECLNTVKTSESNLCLIFSNNIEVTNNANNRIEFYVDPSRINIVDNIKSAIDKEILKTSTNISLELTNVILDKITKTRDELNSKSVALDTISSNNNKIKDSSNSIKSSADSIDLTVDYNTFKVIELFKEIDKVNSSYNMSATDVNSLRNKLSAIDSQINSTISKTSSAKTKIVDLSTNIGNTPAIAENSNTEASNFKTNINNVISDLNSISVTNPDTIVDPIKTEVQTVETQETHIGKFLPTFLVLIIMFVSILLASSIILSERSSPAFLRNRITSTPSSVFLIGAYLTSMVVILFHIIVITIMLNYVIGYEINSFLLTIPVILLISSLFILLGIVIGYFASSQETASVIALIIIAAAIFFSNTILPLETLPLKIKQLILYNPFVISESVLKKMLIFEFSIERVLDLIVKLLWYNVILLVLGYIGLKLSKTIVRR